MTETTSKENSSNENKTMENKLYSYLKRYRTRRQKHFDPNEIFITKAGKKINVNQWIQESKDDTEIYAMIEKYHGDINAIPKEFGGIIGDLTEYQDLRTVMDKEIKAKEMWESLPLKLRAEFGNNKYEFLEKGMAWAQKQENERLEKIAKAQENIQKNTLASAGTNSNNNSQNQEI